jgi:hypothetical protein
MSSRQKWAGAVLVAIVSVGLVLAFQESIRTEYHKWRLQSTKAKRDRCMSARLSPADKLWLQLTGKPAQMSTLNGIIQKHADALVRLGFLHRERFETETAPSADQTRAALAELRNECPWQHF